MQKHCCSRCLYFSKDATSGTCYCFRVEQLPEGERIQIKFGHSDKNEYGCPHFINGNKVRARYAENRVKLENLIELSQEPELMPYGKRGLDKTLLVLEQKVMCDQLTLEKVCKAQASILEGK